MKQKKARRIKPVKRDNVWSIYQNIGQFTKELDRLPDAAAVKKDKQKSVPVTMLDLVF